MNVRRWASGAAVLVVLAVLAVLVVHFTNPSQPVAAGDYKGHPASATPTTQTPMALSGTDGAAARPGTDADESGGRGVVEAAADRNTASGGSSSVASHEPAAEREATSGDRPTWNPAADVPEGADQEPKVPNGLGAQPYRLPDSPERKPALTKVPGAAAAEHELVAGFPEHVVPVPDDVDIQSSSVATQGQRVFVGVNALSDANPDALLDYYVRHCESLAWPSHRPTLDDGTPRLQCGFGPDELTVTASSSVAGGVDLTVSGSFEVR